MVFNYFDMLSGAPILLPNIGHVRSPKLREIYPTIGIGYAEYNVYLNLLSWDKDKIMEYVRTLGYKSADKLNKPVFDAFDVVTIIRDIRESYREVLSFFMSEELVWDESHRRYLAVTKSDNSEPVGEINRDNFEGVRQAILQLNYIGVDKDDAPIGHSTEKSKELWERTQAFLKKQAESSQHEDKPEYHLSNVISKLCVAHPSYNLINVPELTIFQVYDAFFQVGYMRSVDLSERIFSIHGGENFSFEDWFKPILKNI